MGNKSVALPPVTGGEFEVRYGELATGAGYCGVAVSQKGLLWLSLPGRQEEMRRELQAGLAEMGKKCAALGRSVRLVLEDGLPANSWLGELAREITDYYAGRRVKLDFPVDWRLYTPFQQAVLQLVRDIPYGESRTYGQLAALVGRPAAARAVGQVLGANRVLLVVPCHRVLAAHGLGGFGAGLETKKLLLRLEGLVG
ncbi:MAG: methylated-DNA--[protein]-cysteine S-methyltransferase [Bacillota bacterium]